MHVREGVELRLEVLPDRRPAAQGLGLVDHLELGVLGVHRHQTVEIVGTVEGCEPLAEAAYIVLLQRHG
jgi:hypothetical protein